MSEKKSIKYNIDVIRHKYGISNNLKDHNFIQLDQKKNKLHKRIKELEGIVYNSPWNREEQYRHLSSKEIDSFTDEMYYSKRLLSNLYKEIEDRKLHLNGVSKKALNNGGIYTDNRDIKQSKKSIIRGIKL